MKKIILAVLKTFALYKIRRVKPVIIGITGSYGKTTMKEVIAGVLAKKYRVLKSEKSLNTDIGMCLAILEQKSGFSSPIAWGAILFRGFFNAFFSSKADFFVLEYGVDKKGDMNSLIKIARPNVAIITAIAPAHQAVGQFKNIDEIAQEKATLAYAVNEKGLVILNRGNENIRKIAEKVKAKIAWYNDEKGLHASAKQAAHGITVSLTANKKTHSFFMPVIGTFHSDCVQVAAIIGHNFGIGPTAVSDSLKNFTPPVGRMSLIEAKNGATIIDSSYNASPETVINALEILKEFSAIRRIAILGSMNELGEISEKAHREVGRKCGSWLSALITVGESGKIIADECLKMTEKPSTIASFESAKAASEYINTVYKLQRGDVILVKGSQNKVRLERTVKALMAHPEKANKLLCRQEPEWLSKE